MEGAVHYWVCILQICIVTLSGPPTSLGLSLLGCLLVCLSANLTYGLPASLPIMCASLYLHNMAIFYLRSTDQPSDTLPGKSFTDYFKCLHVEPADEDEGEENPILYDIPSANVIELRGEHQVVMLGKKYINYLLADNSDLYNSPTQFRNNMLGYITFVFDAANNGLYERVLGRHLPGMTQDVRDVCEGGSNLTAYIFITYVNLKFYRLFHFMFIT